MGARLTLCLPCCSVPTSRRRGAAAITSEPSDEGLGHSFCYVRPDPPPSDPLCSSSKVHHLSDDTTTTTTTTFRSISGASVSANTSTALSTAPLSTITYRAAAAAAFESSANFYSVPLQPSGPLDPTAGFLSGPIERSFLSGPIDTRPTLGRSLSHALRGLTKAITLTAEPDPEVTSNDESDSGCSNLQWAQGKAGEDRVHVVISEDHGWVFVGIYDGFNGPDATDYLLSNLYTAVLHELEGLLWDDKQLRRSESCSDVLEALSRALKNTEEAYLEIADERVDENPELALMGSCVLALLMMGDDVYLMNVGDSRAVLAAQDSARIGEEAIGELRALQLTLDHSTCVREEVRRIRKEHPDDSSAVVNDRVKGSLRVTRAFGAGFLKQPKWNSALLEMFRIDYVGTSPYITCNPFLHHQKLGPNDRFLILSSDGLYQYFTNEQVVAQVELFIDTNPEGDPAQHLVEEVLFRAAEKAGLDFHELLEIPQGDRRQYHDDISVIIISLEGRIWRSYM